MTVNWNRPKRTRIVSCGDLFVTRFLSSVNFLESCLGVFLLSYGCLISVSHKSGNFGLPIYAIALGSSLLLSATFCSAGLHVSILDRCLLAFAGTTSLAVSMVELVSAFRIEYNHKNWIAYLRKYASELYLNETIINILDRSTWWLVFVAVTLAVLEFIKFLIIHRLRKDLLDFETDKANQLSEPLLWRETAAEEFCDSSIEFLHEQENWDDDPLFWAKPVMLNRSRSPDLSWAEEAT